MIAMRRTVAVATAWTAAARPPRSVNHRQTASRSLLWLVLSLFCAACLNAAIAATYPPLTGRINDTAGLINAATRAEIEGKLKDLEDKSGKANEKARKKLGIASRGSIGAARARVSRCIPLTRAVSASTAA